MKIALFVGLLCSCGSPNTGTGTAAVDAAAVDAAGRDAGMPDAAVAAVRTGDGGPGAVCTFNADCQATARCECSESAGCACQAGVRGTGRNGVDTCATGNDCASALCVEGPGSLYYCSDACLSDSGCTGALPMCLDISLIGQVCVRAPK